MSTPQDWPGNWPQLEKLRLILRNHPEGCRKGDFEHLDTNRPAGVIPINGMSWINIRKRLLADGVAELTTDGLLVLSGKQPTNGARPTGGGYSAEQITTALAEIWEENDAGDPAEITAQLLIKLAGLRADPAEPADTGEGQDPDSPPVILPPPAPSRSPAEIVERRKAHFRAALELLPWTEAEAVSPDWVIEEMFKRGAKFERDEGTVTRDILARIGSGIDEFKELVHVDVQIQPNGEPRYGCFQRVYREKPTQPPQPREYPRSGIQPFAPRPPRIEEEEAAYREKRERIARQSADLTPCDLPDEI